ncbi:MAG: MerR family transcriptional regulator [Actinomycetaceae bacterium]|nr:MerR family transcriptional regulator [Actinomycetaceae bacterium]
MSIGAVVSVLRKEFPALTLSKVRFLEDQGVVSPMRTGSGYRKYSADDLARLQYCLTQQRDHYKPLKVIVEELDQRGQGFDIAAPPTPRVVAKDGDLVFSRPDKTLTLTELRDLSGASAALVQQLLDIGIISVGSTGRFSPRSLDAVKAAKALVEAGLDQRNLRQVVAAANRAKNLVDQVGVRDPEARSEVARELGTYLLTLIKHVLLEPSS